MFRTVLVQYFLILATIYNYFHSIFEPQIATPVQAQNRSQHLSQRQPPSTAAATTAATTPKKKIVHTPAAATTLKQQIACPYPLPLQPQQHQYSVSELPAYQQ